MPAGVDLQVVEGLVVLACCLCSPFLIYLAASAGVSGTRRGSKGLGKATYLATCTLWISTAMQLLPGWQAREANQS